jgi:hypothetical protein
MDVCVVRVAKSGQKAKPGQSGQSSTDNVQERTKKNPVMGMDVVLCVVSREKRQDAGKSRQRNKYG